MSDSTFFAPGEYIEDAMYEDYASKLGLDVEDYKSLLICKKDMTKERRTDGF